MPEAEIVSTASTTTRWSGEAHLVVAIDGHVAGVIVMADELHLRSRPSFLVSLRRSSFLAMCPHLLSR